MSNPQLIDMADVPRIRKFPSDVFFSEYRSMTAPELEVYHYLDLSYEKVLPRVHDHYEFYFFLNGDVRYTVGDKCYELEAGDFLVIQPGQIHYPIIESKSQDYVYERVIFWLSCDYYRHLMEVDPSLHAIFNLVERTGTCHFRPRVEAFEKINSLLRSAWYESRSNQLGHAIVVKSLFAQLFVLLNRIAEAEDLFPMQSDATEDLYVQLVQYVHTHVKERITLKDLSRALFVSESYLSRVFRQHLGMSVHRYILRLKLDRIIHEAITHGCQLAPLVYEYGFQSYSSFYRAFQREYGVSPTEYLGQK